MLPRISSKSIKLEEHLKNCSLCRDTDTAYFQKSPCSRVWEFNLTYFVKGFLFRILFPLGFWSRRLIHRWLRPQQCRLPWSATRVRVIGGYLESIVHFAHEYSSRAQVGWAFMSLAHQWFHGSNLGAPVMGRRGSLNERTSIAGLFDRFGLLTVRHKDWCQIGVGFLGKQRREL